MYIGILKIDIHVPYARSLKEKRQVVKKITDNLRNRFPASVAEVDYMDMWQRAMIGVSLVSSDHKKLESIIDKISLFLETNFDCQIAEIEKEIISW